MNNNFFLYLLVSFVLAFTSAWGQMAVKVEPVKPRFLQGEPVLIDLVIQNTAGQPISLTDKGKLPWFMLKLIRVSTNKEVSPTADVVFPSVNVPGASMVQRKFDLRNIYDLTLDGDVNYRIEAHVLGPNGRVYASEQKMFAVVKGAISWSKISAARSAKGGLVEYQAVLVTERSNHFVYVRTRDADSKHVFACVPIGQFFSVGKIQALTDAANKLHVFFPCTNEYCIYAVITPSGVKETIGYYRKTSPNAGITFVGSKVQVVGAFPDNPNKPKNAAPDASKIPQ